MWTTRPRSEFGRLAAIREGAGPPLLLLHGVGLRAEAWGAQTDALASGFEVIVPDMPGHGESAMIEGEVSLTAYTDRVAEAIKTPVLVAGHSMGAMIALDLASRFPGKVRAAAALNAIYRRTPEAKAAVTARAAALRDTTSADPTPTLARWFDDDNAAAARACRDWLLEASPAGYKAAYSIFAAEDGPSDNALRTLACPALFLTGGAEPNSTPAMSNAMAALAPRGQALIIDGARHMMPMTHGDQVTAALRAFFASSDQR